MTGRKDTCFPGTKVALVLLCLVITTMLFPIAGAQEATLDGFVRNHNTDEPVTNATVTVLHYDTLAVVAHDVTDSQGYYQIDGLSDGKYTVAIEAQGYQNQSHDIVIKSETWGDPNHYELDVTLTPEWREEGDGETNERSQQSFLLAAIVIIFALGAALFLYSQMRREYLLRNVVRKMIFDYIEDNPGMHYRAIQVALDLPMGVFSYHINRLEKEHYVKSSQDGMFRRFYVAGRTTGVRFFLSRIQETILNVIKENQGISQASIAQRINVSRRVVNYHVHILDQAGLIFMESRGRESACYPVFPELWE